MGSQPLQMFCTREGSHLWNSLAPLQATYILVTRNGWLWAGTAENPHPSGITIKLQGTRQTPAFIIREDLNLGSKVCVCVSVCVYVCVHARAH